MKANKFTRKLGIIGLVILAYGCKKEDEEKTEESATTEDPSSSKSTDKDDDSDLGFCLASSDPVVHIVYDDANLAKLMHASNECGSWTIDEVYAGASSQYKSSAALDSNNAVHIAAYIGGGYLYYWSRSNKTGKWTPELVSSSASMQSAIVIDSSDAVHIVYWDTILGLQHATKVSSTWVSTTVSSNSAIYIAAALDSDDYVHIAYVTSAGDVKYATGFGSSWAVTSIAMTPGLLTTGAIPGVSLALDPSENPHICYYGNAGSYDLYLADYSGTWSANTLVTTAAAGTYCSLAYDSQSKYHVSHYHSNGAALEHVTNSGGSVVDSLASDASGFRFTSLALDSNDKVHVAAQDGTNLHLNYYTNLSGSWEAVSVDDNTAVGSWATLLLNNERGRNNRP